MCQKLSQTWECAFKGELEIPGIVYIEFMSVFGNFTIKSTQNYAPFVSVSCQKRSFFNFALHAYTYVRVFHYSIKPPLSKKFAHKL